MADNYNLSYTRSQVDTAIGRALNPDTTPTSGHTTKLVTSHGVAAKISELSDSVNTQVTQIGSNLGDLSQLETTDQTSAVAAINEIKSGLDNVSTDAASITYTDTNSIGATDVQDALDSISESVDMGYDEILSSTPELSTVTTVADTITAGNTYRITVSNVSSGSVVSVSIGSTSSATERTELADTEVTEGQIVTYIPTVSATHWRLWVADASCTITIEKKVTVVDSINEINSTIDTLDGQIDDLNDNLYIYTDVESSLGEWQTGSSVTLVDDGDHNATITVSASKAGRVGFQVNVSAGTELLISYHIEKTTTQGGSWGIGTAFNSTWSNITPASGTAANSSGVTSEDVEFSFIVPSDSCYIYMSGANYYDSGSQTLTITNFQAWVKDNPKEYVDGEIESLRTDLETQIADSEYDLIDFEDEWSTNDSSVISYTRSDDDIVITIASATRLKRCGFDISSISVGETLYIDFTSSTEIVFGVGESLSSAWSWVGNYSNSFYFTKTSSSQIYIYIPANSYSAGTTLTLTGFKVYKAISSEAVYEKVTALESYAFMPSSYIPIKEGYDTLMSLSSSTGAQGSTIYGNYFVQGFTYAYTYLRIYNLSTTEFVQQVDLPTFSNTRYHANTISFSGTKYDDGDDFPLLYICSGYTDSSSVSTSEVYVVRIAGTSGSWTTELIQTITLDFGVADDWTEFVCDPVNDRAWINMDSNNDYICVDLPDITDAEVTINASTTVIDSFTTKSFTLGLTTKSSGQGRFFYHNRVYWVSGVPSYTGEGDEALYVCVDNVLTHCTEAVVPLKNFGLANGTSNTYEPEGCFIWNDDFYVCYRTFIAKLIQN